MTAKSRAGSWASWATTGVNMPPAKVGQLVEATGGTLVRGDAECVIEKFGIDTRRLGEGSGFFALKGETTDGHRFLGEAVQNGIALAVIETLPAENAPAPAALIKVDNAVDALGACGRWVRRSMRNTRWIAVTGSNGKTTTKELIAAGLDATHRVHRTPGNLNNHLGVPLSLLATPADCEIAVIEMGMSAAGEIAYLAEIADPDVGLITNIRAVHMDSFNSVDDVAAAKGELYALMRDDAIAVVNLDDLHSRVQATRHIGPQVTFGQQEGADLRLEAIANRYVPGTEMIVAHGDQKIRVQLQIGGTHAAHDALAALAVTLAVGGNLVAAAERMEEVQPSVGRGKLHALTRGMILVDDSYNSSPPALASVLETLRVSEPRGRRVLVMGDMLELGSMDAALHREAGRRAGAAGIQMLVAVGPMSRETADAARRGGVGEVHHYNDSNSAVESIGEHLGDGDLIVVKGSRGIHLGRVVRSLQERFGEQV